MVTIVILTPFRRYYKIKQISNSVDIVTLLETNILNTRKNETDIKHKKVKNININT